MRGAGDGADLLALEIFRANLPHDGIASRHEPRRRPVIRIAEIDAGAQLRRHRQRGDDGVAPVAGDGIEQRLETPHLDRAGDLDLVADHPRQIDIEACRVAVGAGEIERRIIGLGQKPDHRQARQIGPVRPAARIPEARHRLGSSLRAGLGGRCPDLRCLDLRCLDLMSLDSMSPGRGPHRRLRARGNQDGEQDRRQQPACFRRRADRLGPSFPHQ